MIKRHHKKGGVVNGSYRLGVLQLPVEAQAEEEYKKVVKPYMNISEDRQKNTVFRLCNFLYSNQEVIAGSGVTSVNNNGYSETYAISNMQQATEQMREIIYDGIGTRLAGAF